MIRPGLSRFWPVIAVALALMVVLGLPLFWSFFNRAPELEITPDPGPSYSGNIYINGDVSNPGIYPFGPGDTLADLVQAVGGSPESAGAGQLRLHVGPAASTGDIQKVDINRAGSWLLEALPGIGPSLAAAIIEHRETHGPFADIHELTSVAGIGERTFNQIRDLITVSE